MAFYRTAIIGSEHSIGGLSALGVVPFFADTPDDVLSRIRALREQTLREDSQEKYAVIFITEDVAERMPGDEYERMARDVLPVVLAIPGVGGPTGFSSRRLRRLTERAIGSPMDDSSDARATG